MLDDGGAKRVPWKLPSGVCGEFVGRHCLYGVSSLNFSCGLNTIAAWGWNSPL